MAPIAAIADPVAFGTSLVLCWSFLKLILKGIGFLNLTKLPTFDGNLLSEAGGYSESTMCTSAAVPLT